LFQVSLDSQYRSLQCEHGVSLLELKQPLVLFLVQQQNQRKKKKKSFLSAFWNEILKISDQQNNMI